tara:strand:- start:578 stop:931 length:354 start_codon:yes stop_codon:yes gene_type:complete
MAAISSQRISETGLTPTLTVPESSSNTFTNSGNEFIMIQNNDGSTANTVTVTATTTDVDLPLYGDLTKSNASLSVAAETTAFIGPFPLGAYAGTDNAVTFTLTSTSNVKVAILTLED